MAKPAEEIGHLHNEELPPDLSGRIFEDDLDPGEVVFDGNMTAMLIWHERYPLGLWWRSCCVLGYDTDGQGNPDDYIVDLSLADVDAAVAQTRDLLRSVDYRACDWPLS